ncbi:amino acid permease [Streptococcus oricebi]|uniref:Amino acid permease n=1 Tax=Streptococcus oricebi TaxID=1547447 RepID=A0ABS5B1D9_9STRE|nr:amino acid permease [Streptococcus oricebi]MBP2622644.1 amino acid permease [Streptococcus oricebi]
MSIFRKKDSSQRTNHLKRHLDLKDLILLGIGAIVGTGIFTITGIGAAKHAGPALVISIVISASAIAMSALFSAEFASRIPATGGVYSYIYATFGEYPAWLAGWFMIIEFLAAISGVASGWGSYLKGLLASFGWRLPQALNGSFNLDKGTYIDLFPILVLVLVTGVVLLNSKAALRFNSALVFFKFSALALFILAGLFFIKPENWQPFAPYGFGRFLGAQSGIMAGASIMFFAFLGYESLSMAVDEAKDPQRQIPRAIILTLTIVTVLYVLVTLILTGVVHYSQLNVEDAVAFALRSVGLTWAANYVALVAVLTLITVCIAMTFGLARMIYSISRDGLLPKTFSHIHPKSRVPSNATILVGATAALFAGVFPLEVLASLVNIVTLAYLIMLALGLLKLRRDTGLPKEGEFKTPWVPFLPILSILFCLSFMAQYTRATWLAFLGVFVLGSLIYFAYGYRHSELNQAKQPEK